MASDERLTQSLQESVLTLLAYDKAHGAGAAALLETAHFDDPYREIASDLLRYWRKFKKPPGTAHLDDVFDLVLADKQHKLHRVYVNILERIAEQSHTLNGAYVSTRVVEFIERQTLKAAVYSAAQRYQQGGDNLVPDVKKLLFDALKMETADMSPGVRLADKASALAFLDNPLKTWKTGIKELDRYLICPTEGLMLLLCAPKGRGKSTWATDIGKQCVLQGAMTLHISLENRENQAVQKYQQSFFAISRHNEPYTETVFEFDSRGRLSGLRPRTDYAPLNFDDPSIYRKLAAKLDKWTDRIGRNLIIKEFPTSWLTVPKLDAYLDSLGEVHGIYPEVIIVDSPDDMDVDRAHIRESHMQNYKDLRGLFGRRKAAGVVTAHANRAGAASSTVGEEHVAEDYSKLRTADNTLLFSRTPEEYKLGLCRLHVDKARGDRDGFTVLISQNYDIGQFCVGSTLMDAELWTILKEKFPAAERERPPERNDSSKRNKSVSRRAA